MTPLKGTALKQNLLGREKIQRRTLDQSLHHPGQRDYDRVCFYDSPAWQDSVGSQVVDPYPFKIMVGEENLSSNGIHIPGS